MDENRYITLRPNTKIPDTPKWNRVNRAQAAEHVARGGNIALATGEPSGLFVLDIDVKDDVDGRETLRRCQEVYGLLPLTRTVFTPSGGTHFYFRVPPGFHHTTSASRLGRGIDTRCNGGYVVIPPSRTPDGAYTTAVKMPFEDIPELPEWLRRALESRPVDAVASYRRSRRTGGPRGYAGIIETVRSAPSGTRNTLLNWAAYRMASDGAPQEELQRLADAALANGLPAREVESTIMSAVRAAGAL